MDADAGTVSHQQPESQTPEKLVIPNGLHAKRNLTASRCN
jgi:hypothetical protein